MSTSIRSRLARGLRLLVLSLLGATAWVAVAVAALLAWAFLVEPYRVVVETVEAPVEGWPGGGGGDLRIAFFSDLDLEGPPGVRERRVLDRLRGLHPDLVAFGGDLFATPEAPPAAVIARTAAWLGEVAAEAPHGLAVVWGEQDENYAGTIEAALPPGVRSLHRSQIMIPAGAATVRVCGPYGHFGPLEVSEGSLRGREGLSLTLATYRGPGADAWGSLDLTVRLRYGAPGDGPGVAVLVGAERGGLPLRIAPDSSEWRAAPPQGDEWDGRLRQRGSLPSQTWLRARVRVEVGGERTVVRSRAWEDGRAEPSDWPVEAFRNRGRPGGGTIGVLLGGPLRGTGSHEWDDLQVVDLDGRTLLDEDFADPERFGASWQVPCGPARTFAATVLLLHSPAPLVGLGRQPLIDLVLAGHTHGGQIRLPPFGLLAIDPTIPAGWASGMIPLYHGQRWLYVSRGVGTTAPHARLFCPPEVTDLTLRVEARSAS